jgi:hypothetical protein
MTTCTCLAFALHTCEQLNRIELNMPSAPLDQVMMVARQTRSVCHQYVLCPHCIDAGGFAVYPMLLSKAIGCYYQLLRSASQGASPGAASSSSGSSGGFGGINILRIGSFEVEASLDEQTRAAILRAEVRRVAETVSVLDTVMSPSSLKGVQGSNESALRYNLSLIAALKEEIGGLEHRLRSV